MYWLLLKIAYSLVLKGSKKYFGVSAKGHCSGVFSLDLVGARGGEGRGVYAWGMGVKILGFLFRMFSWTSMVSICWGGRPGGLFFFSFCRSLVARHAWAGD